MADVVETPLPSQANRVYDSDAAAFFTASSTTLDAYKNAIDDFVKSLKLNNLWVYLDQLYINTGTSRGRNLKNLSEQVSYSSSSFSPTSYLVSSTQTATLPRQLSTLDANDYCVFAYNSGRHTNLSYTKNVVLGRADGTRRLAIEQTLKTVRFAYGTGTLELHPESYVGIMFNTGAYVASVKDGIATLQVAGYRQRVAIATNALPTGQLSVGSDTVAGSDDYLTLPFFGVGKGLPAEAINLFNTLCNRLATGLGNRPTQRKSWVRGDSITGDNVNPGAMGSLPSNQDGIYKSFAGRLLQMLYPGKLVGIGDENCGMITGVPGMRIQTGLGGDTSKDYYALVFGNAGNNYGDVVPYNDFMDYQFFAFSTNDIYLDPTNPLNTPAHFKQQYAEILQRNMRLGWPASALKVQSNYVLDAARLGPTIAGREVTYHDAMQAMCQELGVQFFDVRTLLQGKGDIARNVYSVDGVHLNPVAHQDVAEYDYALLTGTVSTPPVTPTTPVPADVLHLPWGFISATVLTPSLVKTDADPYLTAGNESRRLSGEIPLRAEDSYTLNTEGVLPTFETWYKVKNQYGVVSQVNVLNRNDSGDYGDDTQWFGVPAGKFQSARIPFTLPAGANRGLPKGQVSQLTLATPTALSYIIRRGPSYTPVSVKPIGSYIPYTPVALTKTRKPLANLLGSNGFVWDWTLHGGAAKSASLIKTYAPGGFRMYADATTIEVDTEVFSWAPVFSGGWNYDEVGATAKAQDTLALPVLRGQSRRVQETYPAGDRNLEKAPLPYGADKSLPASYGVGSKWGWQFGARYGQGKNLDGTDRKPYLAQYAKVLTANGTRTDGSGTKPVWRDAEELAAPDQNIGHLTYGINTVRLGLGLYAYVEYDNERDKWWMGPQGYQTGREYAAGLSAFCDGHKGSMGPGYGVRDAAPEMKVVMAGLAQSATADYVRGMVDWCAENRGYRKNPDGSLQVNARGHAVVDVPFDVINIHYYVNDATAQRSGSCGAKPENVRFLQALRLWTDLASELGVEVWNTEFGYDTGFASPLRAARPVDITEAVLESDSFAEKDRKWKLDNTPAKQALRERTQGQWNLRGALLSWAFGFDRMMFYWLYNTQNSAYDVFTTAGFLRDENNPLPGAYFFAQAGSVFGNYTATGILSGGLTADGTALKNEPWVVQASNGTRTLYALWNGVDDNSTTSYVLNLPTGGTLYTLSETSGTSLTKPLSAGNNTISVTETACFVIST